MRRRAMGARQSADETPARVPQQVSGSVDDDALRAAINQSKDSRRGAKQRTLGRAGKQHVMVSMPPAKHRSPMDADKTIMIPFLIYKQPDFPDVCLLIWTSSTIKRSSSFCNTLLHRRYRPVERDIAIVWNSTIHRSRRLLQRAFFTGRCDRNPCAYAGYSLSREHRPRHAHDQKRVLCRELIEENATSADSD